MSRYWLVVGTPENWQTAFEHGNIWGLKETQRHLWESLQEGDTLVFYATNPVGGNIGYGSVRTKFRQNKPLWPKELEQNMLIWPLRFEFDIQYCLPPDKWAIGKVVSKDLQPRAGFQLLSTDVAEKLVFSFKKPQYVTTGLGSPSVTKELAKYEALRVGKPEEGIPSHEEVKQALVEVGKLQNFIAESEYQSDSGKLDVVWRRVQQSVPTFVFEIQIGGNIYQALAKLKHAFDVWNSHIFLVSSQEDFSKAFELLSGTFHEIRERLKVIDYLKVKELHARKKGYRELEKELGII